MFFLFIISFLKLSNANSQNCFETDKGIFNNIGVDPVLGYGLFKNGKEVNNICGSENGYDFIVYKASGDQSLNYNYKIRIFTKFITPIVTSNQGFNTYSFNSNPGNTDYPFYDLTFSGTIAANQEKCASLKFKLPEINFDNITWTKQQFIVEVTNLDDGSYSYFESPWFGPRSDFQNYEHYFDNVNASDLNFISIVKHYFHKDLIFDINQDIIGQNPDIGQNFDDKLIFNAGSKAIIKPNKNIYLENVTASTCPNSIWEGFIVEATASIKTNKLNGSRANNVIKLENSKAEIKNSTFTKSKTGLYVDQINSTLVNLENNTFEDLEIGISLHNASNISLSPIDISKPNLFKNISDKGIFAWTSRGIECMFNKFENIGNPNNVVSHQGAIVSAGSNMTIAKNEIKNSSIGVSSNADKLFTVQDNLMDNNKLGISLWKNSDLFAAKYNAISGYQGIRFTNAYPHLDDNHINNNGSFATDKSFGIEGKFSNHATIRDNIIHSSNAEAAINLFNINDNLVWSNDIALLSQNEIAGIRLNGGSGGSVQANAIDAAGTTPGQSFGIVTSNSNADIICNDISQLQEAIVATQNSMGINIETNGMFAVNTGVKLEHSIIGEQRHHGNRFQGDFPTADIYAIDMFPDEITGSKFFIDRAEDNNQNILWPESVACFGDIAKDEFQAGPTETCGQVVYTTRPKDRLLSLCSIINSLKNNTTIDPIRKKNLLAYYFKLINKYFPDKTKWPACLNMLLTPFINTNIEKMAVTGEKINQLLSPSLVSNTLIDNHTSALTSYIEALKNNIAVSQTRTNFLSAQDNLLAAYPDRTSLQNSILSSIESDLLNFIPSDIYETAWLDVEKAWLKSYKGEPYTSSDKATLTSIAVQCPLQYGEVVYGARALVSEWDNTRYDLIDCNDAIPRESTMVSGKSAHVYPNPASTTLHIDFIGTAVDVVITNLEGRQIVKKSISQGEGINVSSMHSGMYIVSIADEYGKLTTEKFLKVD
jgi:hypothetical protein